MSTLTSYLACTVRLQRASRHTLTHTYGQTANIEKLVHCRSQHPIITLACTALPPCHVVSCMSNIPTYAQTTTVLHITCIHNLPFYICTKSGTPQCWCMLQHLLRVLYDSTPQIDSIALLHSLSCGCSLLQVVELRKTNLACTNSAMKRARAVHDVQKSFPSPHAQPPIKHLFNKGHTSDASDSNQQSEEWY